MTEERLNWIMSGLNRSRLNKVDKAFMKKIEKKFEQVESITGYEERRLEQIHREKSR